MNVFSSTVLAASLLIAHAPPCRAVTLVSQAQLATHATVEALVDAAHGVHGLLINHGDKRIENVQLLVRHAWIWSDSRRSPDAAPGWVEYHTLPLVIAGGGRAPFAVAHLRRPPARDDGHLFTTVTVVSLTELTTR